MNVFCAGRPDERRRALVLVHGAGGTHALWGLVTKRLRQRAVPAIALDLPAHGRSPGPARQSIGAFADVVGQALRAVGVQSCVVAGHSLGGAVALTLAARQTEGLHGVGVVSSGARLPVDPLILEGILQAFEATVEKVARFCFAKGTAEAIWRQAAETMAAAGASALYADLSACAAYGLSDEEIAAIRVPTVIVCGELDVLSPISLSEELVRKVPGAHLARLPRCGHMPLLEDPDGLADALVGLWKRSFPEAVE